jgi:hypothetical protein
MGRTQSTSIKVLNKISYADLEKDFPDVAEIPLQLPCSYPRCMEGPVYKAMRLDQKTEVILQKKA